ncbi:MAG: metallophosphoesterase [Acidimicrobiales bacterium]|nr:metallophosphoesterase [Acidimicrobiales bacterium]
MVALAALPVGVYATYVEPFWLRVERVSLAVDGLNGVDGVDEPIRIGVLADLQTTAVGEYERDAVERLLGFEPDIVLLPGDLYQFDAGLFDERAPGFTELVRRIVGEVPLVYLVSGNTDTVAGLRRITEGTGARVLDNEIDTFELKGVSVIVGGTTLFGDDAAARRMARRLAGGGQGLTGDGVGLAGGGDDDSDGGGGDDDGGSAGMRTGPGVRTGSGVRSGSGVRILIGHKPDAIELVRQTPVDLVVSGHTHGGQVSLPLFGPPLTLTGVPRHVAAGGLHELHGTPIYVSTGVGRERGNAPQLRLGVRPSIGIIDLVAGDR